MLQNPFSDLFFGPSRLFQSHLRLPISVYSIFDFTEHVLHKDGLRTNPAAKKTTVHNGKKRNKNDQSDHGQYEKVKILWPEYLPENDKLSLEQIELKQGLSFYSDKRREEQKGQQEIADPCSPFREVSGWFFGKEPFSLSRLIDSRHTISEGFLLLISFLYVHLSAAVWASSSLISSSITGLSRPVESAGATVSSGATHSSPWGSLGAAGVVPSSVLM